MPISSAAAAATLSSLLISCLLGLTPALSAQWSEQHKLLEDGGQAGNRFGSAVSTDGTLVAVGAPGADELGDDSGSAYVFGAQSGAQLHELVPVAGAAGDQFGFAIAVDGAHVVVGAPLADGAGTDSGAAYVFDATTGLQLFELEPADHAAGDQFGYAVAIDSGLVVVGALGGAYLFDAATGQQLESLVPDGGLPVGGSGVAVIDGGFGQAVDIGGGRIVVGAKAANGSSLYSGAAYVFDTSGDELQVLSAGPAWSQFGGSVGIDGTTVVIGARYASPNGKDSGAAYLFDALTGQQTASLAPSDGHIFQHFGSSVGIDGLHVVIGAEWDNGVAFSSGAMYLYDAQGNLDHRLIASDAAALDELGAAVAVGDGVLVAGAARDDDNGDSSGSTYVFDTATWTDLGGGSPGTNGTPALVGEGTLVGGTPVGIHLSSAPLSAPVLGWLSTSSVPFDALGGTVYANPWVGQFFLFTNGAGELSLNTTWPLGVPLGTEFWFQYICQNGPGDLILSNAVKGLTP